MLRWPSVFIVCFCCLSAILPKTNGTAVELKICCRCIVILNVAKVGTHDRLFAKIIAFIQQQFAVNLLTTSTNCVVLVARKVEIGKMFE